MLKLWSEMFIIHERLIFLVKIILRRYRDYVPIDINHFIAHPDPERLYHTTGVYAPCSLRKTFWVLFRPTRLRTAKEL